MNNKKFALFAVVIFIISSLSGAVFGFLAGIYSKDIAQSGYFNNIPFVKDKLPSIQEHQKEEKNNNVTQRIVEESSAIEAVKKASPAVVSIVVTKDLSKLYNSTIPNFPFNDFFGFDLPFEFRTPQAPKGKQEIGGGTGFVFNKEKGLILTNKHVVADTEAEYSVLTNDGKKYEAEVLARDPFNDIAIIKVKVDNLSEVELGDSDSLEIGQTVIAIGNALGEYRNTVTKGVVSGINRNIIAGGVSGSEKLENIIQTDAAINPGNSGGPLIDLSGKVVGINTAIDRSGQSVGFAIPINEAKKVIESVEKFGKIVRPYLGVRYILLNKEIAKENNLDVDHGALIIRGEKRTDLAVIPGSPADKADLKENDIILKVNDIEINQDNSLAETIQKYNPGDEVMLTILSKGKKKQIKVVLGEFKN